MEELLSRNIDAAIISSATEAHFETVETLLQHGVHVYIDKPVSLHLHETKIIADLAEKSGTNRNGWL